MDNNKNGLTIAVMGMFSSGKTTVINSLLGEEVLYTHALTDFNNIYKVEFGEKKEVILHFKNHLPEKSLVYLSSKIVDYLQEHGINNVPPLRVNYDELKDYVKDKDIGEPIFENITVLMPLPILEAGIEFIDLPSFPETCLNNNVIHDYLGNANYILFVLNAVHLLTRSEINVIEQLQEVLGTSKIIFAINKIDIFPDKEVELVKKYAETKLAIFTDNPIFYVSGQRALCGVVNNKSDLIDEYGITELSSYIKKLALQDNLDGDSFCMPYAIENSLLPIEDKQFKEYYINNSTIKVVFGDILDSKGEVIVSSDDCYITMGGGVSMAIRLKEGTGAIGLDVKKKVPADIGNVIVSTAGTLPQKNIFHIITIGYNKLSQSNTSEKVSNDDIHQYIIGHSIDKCFLLLHAMDMKSIAFPLIGGGVAGIPFEKVAQVMAESIGRNLRKTNKSFNVEIYLYDRFEKMEQWDFLSMFEQFAAQEAIAKMLNDQKKDRLFTDDVGNQQELVAVPNMDKDIFISYSRKDKEIVNQIYLWLEKSGYKCWLDIDGMFSGVSYKKVIVDAIKCSKILLFMSSEYSNRSRNVVSEVSIAVEYNKKIIPVRLDMSPYSESIEYDIINYDYVLYNNLQIDESNREILKKIVSTMRML